MHPPTPWLLAAPGLDPTVGQLAALCTADDLAIAPVVVVVGRESDARHAEELRARLSAAGVDGLVTLRPQVDALKEVDEDGVVVDSVDRARYALLGYPQVVSGPALATSIRGLDPASPVNPALALVSTGARVRALVPSP